MFLLNPNGVMFGIGSQNYFLVVRGDLIEVIRRKKNPQNDAPCHSRYDMTR